MTNISVPPPGIAQPLDVLRWPIVGRALRARHARLILQLTVLAAAVIIVLHGLLGPQIAPRNLATVVTWVHYRGLLVIALLAAGNLFCTGCPFVLVRDAARAGRTPAGRWPRVLRTKWIGLALFALVLFLYELFDLWSLPRATAWLILGYFGAALAIDTVFAGATFCKYLCPIGQFNFVASTLSPLEVTARDLDVCRGCATADCIRGRRGVLNASSDLQVGREAGAGGTETGKANIVRRGCELGLFLPLKVGNMDCTFCLDCVHACPHDNVGIVARLPGLELVDGRRRSGIGRFASRPDIAALAGLFTFGALFNAFAMTGPAYDAEAWLAGFPGASSEGPVLAILFVLALVAFPAVLLVATSAASRALAGSTDRPLTAEIVAYAMALVPFGFGLWIAHYAFHFLTGALTIVPVVQSAVIDAFGWPVLGDPLWLWTGLRPGAVFPIQLGFLLLGLAGSIAVAHGISERERSSRAMYATAPWATMLVLLTVLACWILVQPMDMRGVTFSG